MEVFVDRSHLAKEGGGRGTDYCFTATLTYYEPYRWAAVDSTQPSGFKNDPAEMWGIFPPGWMPYPEGCGPFTLFKKEDLIKRCIPLESETS